MLQMATLIAIGIIWQRIAPKHISVLSHRRALTDLVFYILLPALVLNVMWQAPLNIDSIKISATALSSLLASLAIMWIVLQFLNVNRPQKGALLIAATFPNATYMGLPVTAQALGDWSQVIVLKYDLFACTPMVLTLGILIAHHFGESNSEVHPIRELAKVSPLWALSVALLLNLANITQPEEVHNGLAILAGGVVPLMLIALGMSIRWDTLTLKHLPTLLPVSIIALIIAPIVAYTIATALHLPNDILITSVILAAMPTMIFGIVICERYQLDSSLYAAAIFLTTVLSIGSLTIWFHLLA